MRVTRRSRTPGPAASAARARAAGASVNIGCAQLQLPRACGLQHSRTKRGVRMVEAEGAGGLDER